MEKREMEGENTDKRDRAEKERRERDRENFGVLTTPGYFYE